MLGSLVVCFRSCAHTLSFFSCWGTPEFNDACNAVWRSMVTNGIDAQRLFLAHQISWMQGDTQTATYIGWHDDSIDIFHKRCLPRGGGGVEEASQVTHTNHTQTC